MAALLYISRSDMFTIKLPSTFHLHEVEYIPIKFSILGENACLMFYSWNVGYVHEFLGNKLLLLSTEKNRGLIHKVFFQVVWVSCAVVLSCTFKVQKHPLLSLSLLASSLSWHSDIWCLCRNNFLFCRKEFTGPLIIARDSTDKYILEVVRSCIFPTFIVVPLYAHA